MVNLMATLVVMISLLPQPEMSCRVVCLLACLPAWLGGADTSFRTGKLLYSDDFAHGLSRWSVELEKGGVVEAKGGILTLDVPAGCTVWFRPELRGQVAIEYQATMIRRGGPNDRISDLNCFWMARDAQVKRSGKFADYNTLRGYYVGQGGNTNTTTRFRRYIGDPVLRPLLPEHDLTAPLLEPNVTMKIRLVADGSRIQYFCNGRAIFIVTLGSSK